MKALKKIIRIVLLFLVLLGFIYVFGIPLIKTYKIYLYTIKDFLTIGVSINFLGLAIIESIKEFK